jgi:demethylmenaquinone methyltransferase/2-methoxy-6-polyprenyl-1,4-benzoquinol methylase
MTEVNLSVLNNGMVPHSVRPMDTVTDMSTLSRPISTGDVRTMFDRIAPTYDKINRVLSLGVNWLWEWRLVRNLPKAAGGLCLDVCTGTGALVPRLAPHFRGVVAVDISKEMLSRGRKRCVKIPQCAWIESDAQDMPFADDSFDAISISYGIRNLPSPETGLREMLRVCLPGGTIGVLEFGQPKNRIWSKLYSLYSKYVIPAVGGYISGERAAYQYLPNTAAAFPCGGEFEELLKKTGWIPRKRISLCGGIAFIYIADKPLP